MSRKLFADRLREAMTRQNLKQVDLIRAAAAANVKLGKSHVSQYVSGKTVPRSEILDFLAKELHVDSGWLLEPQMTKRFQTLLIQKLNFHIRRKIICVNLRNQPNSTTCSTTCAVLS